MASGWKTGQKKKKEEKTALARQALASPLVPFSRTLDAWRPKREEKRKKTSFYLSPEDLLGHFSLLGYVGVVQVGVEHDDRECQHEGAVRRRKRRVVPAVLLDKSKGVHNQKRTKESLSRWYRFVT